MSWIASIFIGILTAVVGCLGTGFVADVGSRWHHVSDREGGRGYLVVFMALLGAAGGLIVGIVTSRFLGGPGFSGFFRGVASAFAAALTLVVIAGAIAYMTAEHAPTIRGHDLYLEVEVKLPEKIQDLKVFGETKPYADLYDPAGRSSRRGDLRTEDAVRVDGRWVLPAKIYIHSSGSGRVVSFTVPTLENEGHGLPLGGRPGERDLQWSDWYPHKRPDGTGGPNEKIQFSYRYRVVVDEPAPEPAATPDENAETGDAEKKRLTEVRALTDTSPLEAWLAFTGRTEPAAVRAFALGAIRGRATLAADVAALLRGESEPLAIRYIRDECATAPGEWTEPFRAALTHLRGRVARSLADSGGPYPDAGAFDVQCALDAAGRFDDAAAFRPEIAALRELYQTAPRVRRVSAGSGFREETIKSFDAERALDRWLKDHPQVK